MRGKTAERQTQQAAAGPGKPSRATAATADEAFASPASKPDARARSRPGQLASEADRLEAGVVQTLAREVEALRAALAAAQVRVAELEARADHDPLTGLLNRRGFERELARAAAHVQRYGGRLVLIYLDLDGFKPVNDTHGHAAGDAVLRAVAEVLRAHVRASDLVARLGGDEFAVLLWNLADADADAKAAALEAMIAAVRVPWAEAEIAVGASAGTAPLTDPSAAAEALARADAAMYARKRRRGRRDR
ncbi:GGDEF domain-containing protein [Rhodoplanes sp. TEM]|uniref:diguanylate cyclase n=1 Tax=Rhodoplanes tepidamans TaxID=200616 RepID=A0ABT5J5E1_RHOTP|nr:MULTISPECIES: GGDEF domain-containing protein [Rhodoplanes]MDC7784873.1 GGDEF domain-containing protein [Rhodoplanes tepidamans]MDC7986059.1 GGDEF domain-containing protein [Rhodoplanes sp. TEM]MDQ0353900.1 diguanylate cyclase (GGDEF)-like protein [Rhodoplanes tepidamans]